MLSKKEVQDMTALATSDARFYELRGTCIALWQMQEGLVKLRNELQEKLRVAMEAHQRLLKELGDYAADERKNRMRTCQELKSKLAFQTARADAAEEALAMVGNIDPNLYDNVIRTAKIERSRAMWQEKLSKARLERRKHESHEEGQ